MTDPIPFDTLLSHREWVRGLARSLVADPGLADDVEQETWLAALRRPPRDAATVRSWFVAVARNFARQGHRSSSRRERREAVAARAEAVAGPDEVVAQADVHRRVVDAVMSLDEPSRTAILLRYFEGLTAADAAARTGVTEAAFRTRVRRGIERLRREFAERGELRAVLLPLIGDGASGVGSGTDLRPSGHLTSSRTPGRAAAARPWIIAGVVGAAATASWLAGIFDGADGDTMAVAPAKGAPVRVPGGALPGQVPAPAPAAPTPGPHDDPQEPAVVVAPPAPADAGASASAPAADGVLQLLTRIDPAVPPSGAPIELVATLRNAGAGDVSFFVPDDADDLFPVWRFRRDDGATWAPLAPSRQSMWTRGMDGSVVTLAPGKEWTWRGTFTGFEPLDAAGRSAASLFTGAPLPPGRYVVQCTYAWSRTTVPWRAEAFRYEERPQPGLWTGSVSAVERALHVDAAAAPALLVDGDVRIAAGPDAPLRVRLVNPLREPLRLRGSFRLAFVAKGGPAASAAFVPGEPGSAANPGDTCDVDVAPGAEARWTIDPALLTFRTHRSGGSPAGAPCGVHELWPLGGAIAGVEFVPEGATEPTLRSPWFMATWAPLPDAASTDLRLGVTLRDEPGGGRTLCVELRNDGAAPRLVLQRLAYPADLAFALRRTDGGESAAGWDAAAFETCEPVAAADFGVLEPGRSLRREIDLGRLLAAPLAAGAWELTATWRAAEDGRRLGLSDPAPVVGRLTSSPLRIDAR
jgi:RNA polymerase sigma-70 factor (ECF subfamily)